MLHRFESLMIINASESRRKFIVTYLEGTRKRIKHFQDKTELKLQKEFDIPTDHTLFNKVINLHIYLNTII